MHRSPPPRRTSAVCATLAALWWGAMPCPARAADGTTPAPTTHERPAVSLDGDRLTVHAVDMPLDEVLRRIAEGARLEGTLRQPRSISIELDGVPLQEGLQRLLGDQNFMLAYRADGRLSRLTLLGGPIEEARTRVVPAEPKAAAPAPAAVGGGLLERSVAIAPDGAVAKLLNRRKATLQELLDLAARNPSVEVRLDALRNGVKAVESQQDLAGLATGVMHSMDDAALEAAVRSFAGEHAYEIVSQVTILATNLDTKQRALRLMQRMNGTP